MSAHDFIGLARAEDVRKAGTDINHLTIKQQDVLGPVLVVTWQNSARVKLDQRAREYHHVCTTNSLTNKAHT